MTNFYDASPAEQAERLTRLARAALQEWELGGEARVDLVKHRENAVFRVRAGDESYALRVHRAGYHSDAHLESELQWIAAISSDELRTPQVVLTKAGASFAHVSAPEVPETRQVDLLEWFEGEPVGTVEGGVESVEDTFFQVGQLMATAHNHSAAWQRPPGFVRHAWDEDGIFGDDPVWGRFFDLEALTDEQRDRLREVTARARQDLAALGKGGDRYGLIHADFLPENLLRGDDGSICLIDFDDAGFGWHLFDVATTLFFQLGEPTFEASMQSLVAGYRTRRDLPDELLESLPLFFLLRGLTYLGWAHTRRETETARELTPMVVAAVDEMAREYLA